MSSDIALHTGKLGCSAAGIVKRRILKVIKVSYVTDGKQKFYDIGPVMQSSPFTIER